MARQDAIASEIHGTTAPGFEAVRSEFENNLRMRGELGAAFAAYHRGRLVVDLWGGHLDRQRTRPWQRDSVTTVFSTTKGISALALALGHSQRLFEWDTPVARYWPEFAQAGKQDVTVRQLCAHQAGLSAIDVPLDVEILSDLDRLADILARQKPAWTPGTRHGYHAVTLGWFQSELLRRVDPQQRSLGQFFREELAEPLELDFRIGWPAELSAARIAPIHPMRPLTALRTVFPSKVPNRLPPKMIRRMLNPKSLSARSFANPKLRNPADLNRSPALREVEIPSANGIGDARSIAKVYGSFATGGTELNLRKETLDSLMADAVLPSGGLADLVLHTDTTFSLGFMKPRAGYPFASSPRAFGAPGAGGSFGFADPDARLGMGYVMNQMGVYLVDDPREKALRDATYRALAALGPGN